ncbi:Smr/MutS family protein [Arenicella xantha]|uniref:DNA-nicking Smr family endonuclease n=1 Tax=Arenicella xantha TaxID=644221 RepID=A0A395JJS9_9GAMM|nr:Smr/MutS family protein [Arenicella xantha]RBP49152.1 DNA-nicking Smr family endonuclease [Arenicella xantha]
MTSHDDPESMSRLLGLGVRPLKQDKIKPYRKPADPTPRQRLLDDERVMQELLEESDETASFESGDELKFLRAGFSTRLLKKLRRGDYAIQDELDLHGLIVSEAKQQTHGFINECARDKVSAVRIVHGKGRNSAGRMPVLKNMLIGWLSKNQHVVAVVSTPANDGGTGAVYVLLGKQKPIHSS